MKIEIRIDLDNTKVWYKMGDWFYYHREDGPAVICSDGKEYWWYHSRKYYDPKDMPLNLYLAYCRWENKKNGG